MLELICVGDELLDGRTRDRNAHWLGERLRQLGLVLDRVTFVGDDTARIVAALHDAAKRARHVLVSGGLGPTDDDRTRHAAAEWLAVPLHEDEAVLTLLEERFARYGRPFAPTNRQQALFPEGALVLATEVGTAAGFRLRRGHRTLDFVPGVPREFQWFADRYWLPLVGPRGEADFADRRWRLFGLGESEVGAALTGLEVPGASIHYTARFPEVHVYVRASGAAAQVALETVGDRIHERMGTYLLGEGEASLAERVGEALTSRSWRITTAESCTGGQIAQALTSVSGSSSYFDEAAVTYSNDAKIARLGVRPETLAAHGAVSPETAVEMARGARARARAELAVAVTGIAGPTGGSPDKPVGTVDVALATPEGVFHRRLSLPNRPREAVRTYTTWAALGAVLWYLEERLPEDWTRVP